MALTGSEVFLVGVGVTVVAAILSFVVVSVSLASSRNKRRQTLVEARRLQGIPDAIVVEDDEQHAVGSGGGGGDIEKGTVVPSAGGEDGGATKRKESAEEKRKKKLREMDIPVGEVYDGAYGKRERNPGLCYSIFTRKSTVLLHLQWVKIISCALLVLQCAFLAISMLRGLYILSFPQYGVASVGVAFFMALYSLHQEVHCCLRWCLLAVMLPVVFASDLLDSATLAVEYACKRDGSPCSSFTAEVVLLFFCLRMVSLFLTVWVTLLTTFLTHELGCCDDHEVYAHWDKAWNTKHVTLDCVPSKDFPRRRGKSLAEAIRRRKEELQRQQEKEAGGGGDSGEAPARHAAVFVSALNGVSRGTKKSVFKQKRASDGGAGGRGGASVAAKLQRALTKRATAGSASSAASAQSSGGAGDDDDDDSFADLDADFDITPPKSPQAGAAGSAPGSGSAGAGGGDSSSGEEKDGGPEEVVVAGSGSGGGGGGPAVEQKTADPAQNKAADPRPDDTPVVGGGGGGAAAGSLNEEEEEAPLVHSAEV